MDNIPEFIKIRTPLFKPEWFATLQRMRENVNAPRWNIEIGDRLNHSDIELIKQFEDKLNNERFGFADYPPDSILKWIQERRDNVLYFKKVLFNVDLKNDFENIKFMSREDLANRLEEIVPDNADLSRLIVNPTSGTTGHSIKAPSHPFTQGCYDPLIQYCLKRNGVDERYDHEKIAAIQLCFQSATIVYNAVHSYLNGAGFAKINLNPKEWNAPDSANNFISDLSPVFLSGDPASFMEMMKQGIDYKPKAFLSSALQLSGELRRELETEYNCPVIDFYSLNETGPIAFSLPDNPEYFQILPTDIYVEIVDNNGRRLPEGEYGEITVTGGRNPYFPALRYKTGDTGAIFYNHKFDGKTPLLKILDSRKPVIFSTNSGNMINSVDIGRIFRKYPIYRHQVIQNKDKSLIINLDAKNISIYKDEIINEIFTLFNNDIDITLSDNFISKNNKIAVYIVE